MLFPAPDMPVIKMRDMRVSVPTNHAPGADVVTAAARGGASARGWMNYGHQKESAPAREHHRGRRPGVDRAYG